jgi:predicted metalloprotease with PDZ domain
MAINTNSIDEVVKAYFERLEERGLGEWVDKVFPNESVFEEIRRLAGLSAEEVVERLAQAVSERLLPEVAEEVVGVPKPVAVWYLARRIAMWYLQLAEELGVVRGVWR